MEVKPHLFVMSKHFPTSLLRPTPIELICHSSTFPYSHSISWVKKGYNTISLHFCKTDKKSIRQAMTDAVDQTLLVCDPHHNHDIIGNRCKPLWRDQIYLDTVWYTVANKIMQVYDLMLDTVTGLSILVHNVHTLRYTVANTSIWTVTGSSICAYC